MEGGRGGQPPTEQGREDWKTSSGRLTRGYLGLGPRRRKPCDETLGRIQGEGRSDSAGDQGAEKRSLAVVEARGSKTQQTSSEGK